MDYEALSAKNDRLARESKSVESGGQDLRTRSSKPQQIRAIRIFTAGTWIGACPLTRHEETRNDAGVGNSVETMGDGFTGLQRGATALAFPAQSQRRAERGQDGEVLRTTSELLRLDQSLEPENADGHIAELHLDRVG